MKMSRVLAAVFLALFVGFGSFQLIGCGDKPDPNTCSPACAADETCNNGKCEKKTDPNVCDPACGTDEECKAGKCEKKATSNPAP